MVPRALPVAVTSLVSLFIVVSFASITAIDAQSCLATVDVGNRGIFPFTVESVRCYAYDQQGRLLAEGTMAGERVLVPPLGHANLTMYVQLMVSRFEVSQLPQDSLIRVEAHVVYSVGIFGTHSYVGSDVIRRSDLSGLW